MLKSITSKHSENVGFIIHISFIQCIMEGPAFSFILPFFKKKKNDFIHLQWSLDISTQISTPLHFCFLSSSSLFSTTSVLSSWSGFWGTSRLKKNAWSNLLRYENSQNLFFICYYNNFLYIIQHSFLLSIFGWIWYLFQLLFWKMLLDCYVLPFPSQIISNYSIYIIQLQITIFGIKNKEKYKMLWQLIFTLSQ